MGYVLLDLIVVWYNFANRFYFIVEYYYFLENFILFIMIEINFISLFNFDLLLDYHGFYFRVYFQVIRYINLFMK